MRNEVTSFSYDKVSIKLDLLFAISLGIGSLLRNLVQLGWITRHKGDLILTVTTNVVTLMSLVHFLYRLLPCVNM